MAGTELSLQVRRQLARYIQGQLSLRQFKLWLSPISLTVFEGPSDTDVAELVAEVELRMAEHSDGHWTEPELRRLLRPTIGTYRSSFVLTESLRIVSGTATTVTDIPLNYSVSSRVDTSLAMESA